MKNLNENTVKKSSERFIRREGKQKLNPDQASFNRLMVRLEKLRADIDRKERQLEKAILFYGQHIPPLETKHAQKSRSVLELLMPLFRLQKMPKTRKAAFKAMLQDLLMTAVHGMEGEPDEDLKALYGELMPEDYASANAREKREVRQQMRRQLQNLGIQMEWEEEEEQLSEEAFIAKMQMLYRQFMEKQEAEENAREARSTPKAKNKKPTEKHILQQAAVAEQQKEIATIYRQLAKVLHPDLERDEARRAEKEALMKELTEAYETRNLHKLLLLELKWLHQSPNALAELAEDRLKRYLSQLRKQVSDLERERAMIVHQPRFHALAERYGLQHMAVAEKVIYEEMAFLKDEIDQMEEAIVLLENEDRRLPHAKRILDNREARNEEWQAFG